MRSAGRSLALCLAAALLGSMVAGTRNARATLGEPADSTGADRKALSAVRGPTTSGAGYTVQEMRTDAYTVREYVSPSGIVFGIAWNGLAYPDLTPLLGSFAGTYEDALRRTDRAPGRRRLAVRAGRVVVEKWGHMRNLQGRAYVPDLIPEGVTVDEIR
jgi:Protein of unknown function (DUF2844)